MKVYQREINSKLLRAENNGIQKWRPVQIPEWIFDPAFLPIVIEEVLSDRIFRIFVFPIDDLYIKAKDKQEAIQIAEDYFSDNIEEIECSAEEVIVENPLDY